jgi:hypothetical protein
MNPALKRFLKAVAAGTLAAALTAALSAAVHFLQTDPTAFGASTALLTAVLLGIEKATQTPQL